jgi:hypothetical protein
VICLGLTHSYFYVGYGKEYTVFLLVPIFSIRLSTYANAYGCKSSAPSLDEVYVHVKVLKARDQRGLCLAGYVCNDCWSKAPVN